MKGLLLSLICAGLLVGQQHSQVDDAWRLAAKGQTSQAIDLLHNMIGKNPQNADARLLLGSLLMEVGNGSEAIAQLSKGVALRPKSAEAQNALGEAYGQFDQPTSARKAFERAAALNPRFGVAQLNLGRVLLEANELQPAAQHLDEATKQLGRGADAADAHYLRAKIFTAQDNVQSATDHLQQAVTLRPDFAEAWSDLGEARITLLDDKGALTALQRAVELAPNDPIAQRRLGSEYLAQDQPHLAAEHLQKSYEIEPHDQSTLNGLQSALRQDGNIAEADDIKKKLAELLQNKDKLVQAAVAATQLNNEGAALQKAGDLGGAAEKYRQAVDLTPDNVPMRVNYAVALLRLGSWTEGLKQLHEALQRDPHNSKLQAAWRDALSQAPAGSVSPEWTKPGR